MANPEHIKILRQGIEVWNKWREENPAIIADLSVANLSKANLKNANLSKAELTGANLSETNLQNADLSFSNLSGAYLLRANLSKAILIGADLTVSNLSKADLSHAVLQDSILTQANLSMANLYSADLTRANLMIANLFRTNLENAILSETSVYGVSMWDVSLEGSKQNNLIISAPNQTKIQVDNIEAAQLIYLILNNSKLRGLINQIKLNGVLILGRFTQDRKPILDIIRNILRQRNYLPILYDFDKPSSRDMTELILTLGYMTRFIIADITDAKSFPHEILILSKEITDIPLIPLVHSSEKPTMMMKDLMLYPSVLPAFLYKSKEDLIASFDEKIIKTVEEKLRDKNGLP